MAWANAITGQYNSMGGANTTYTAPLDLVTGACYAYSFRQLGKGYRGPLIQVYNYLNSTDKYTDIGFGTDSTFPPTTLASGTLVPLPGDFDWTAPPAIGSAVTTLYMTKWYDQSGCGNPLTYVSSAKLGILTTGTYINSAYYMVGKHICWASNTAASTYTASLQQANVYPYLSEAFTIIMAIQYTNIGQSSQMISWGGGGAGYMTGESGALVVSGSASISGGTIVAGTSYVVAGVYNGASSYGYINGSQVCTGSIATAYTSTFYVGQTAGVTVMQGHIGEILIYPFALSSTQISVLSANIRAFWGF